MNTELYKLGLVEAARGIKSGIFSAEEYTRSLLQRIEEFDNAVQAWAHLEPGRALAAARRCDAKAQKSNSSGPLRSIPFGIKDIFDTKQLPTEMGSPIFAGNRPDQSAWIVKRLESQGGLILGKTVTTECAFLSPGKTRNPWNPQHTPGGSSSGSAAAVAAGFVPAAIGSQTNGSTIRPAAFCGVVGFKPTQGMLSTKGALTFSHTLDQVGVFTRNVADAEWILKAVVPERRLSCDLSEMSASRPRLAALRTTVWDQAEKPAQDHFLKSLEEIRKSGVEVFDVELPEIFNFAHQAIRAIMAVESAFNLEELRLMHAPELSKILTDFLAEGRELAAVVYLQALRLRRLLQIELLSFLLDYDAAITLPATGEAPATLAQTGNPAFCSIWNLCGVPAITIPTGLGPFGLPLGLQVVAAHGYDYRVLSIAARLEEIFSFEPLWSRK